MTEGEVRGSKTKVIWNRHVRVAWKLVAVCGHDDTDTHMVIYDIDTKEVLHEEKGPKKEKPTFQDLQEGVAMFENALKKAKAAREAKAGERAVEDADFEAKYPTLFAFLAATMYEGKPRTTARISIFADQGTWKASLVDVENEQSIFTTLKKPQEVFAALEKALGVDEPEWRVWRAAGTATTSRRRKSG